MASRISGTRILIESRMQDALEGDPAACFDLGIAYSAGDEANLVEAHIWFNRAVQGGYAAAEACRTTIAQRMTGREMAQARRWTRESRMAHVQQAARLTASLFS